MKKNKLMDYVLYALIILIVIFGFLSRGKYMTDSNASSFYWLGVIIAIFIPYMIIYLVVKLKGDKHITD